jgi:hypothetical protein
MACWRYGRPSIGDNVNRLGRDTPVYISLLEEVTRRDETMDLTEMGLDERLAQEKPVSRDGRKASIAAVRRCAVAPFLSFGPHHQTVVSAYRIIVMKRHDNAGAREDTTDQRYEFYPYEQNMMDVNDVGAEILKQGDEMRDNSITVDLAEIELIEMPAPHNDFVGSVSRRLEACPRTLPTMEVVRCGQEQSLHVAAGTVLFEEIVGENLRSARVKVRMIMGDDQHARSHVIYSGFMAMMTS